jgi:hypothetical protein
MSANRFRVTASHGEGASVYHVIDSWAPDDEQPAVVHSFSTREHGARTRAVAETCRDLCERVGRERNRATVPGCPF